MIVFDQVGKRFRIGPGPRRKAGVVDALVQVSVEIERGAVVAVVGPNGAGKSTLFALLLGFLEPTQGELAIEGQDPRAYMRAKGAGFLPERFRLPAEWRVADALHAFAGLERLPRERASQALADFGLTGEAEKPVGALSHGMLQRLGLAQALLAERALIVLDEPTEGLDAYWRVRFRDLIAQQRARGATVLIASHDLNELERLCDRAILLDTGRVREVIVLRAGGAARTYRIELAASSAALHEVFPAARAVHGAHSFEVEVTDIADFNRRLAALLSTGATIVAAQPADTLEAHVTRDLGTRS